jgi:hypothetical protein
MDYAKFKLFKIKRDLLDIVPEGIKDSIPSTSEIPSFDVLKSDWRFWVLFLLSSTAEHDSLYFEQAALIVAISLIPPVLSLLIPSDTFVNEQYMVKALYVDSILNA